MDASIAAFAAQLQSGVNLTPLPASWCLPWTPPAGPVVVKSSEKTLDLGVVDASEAIRTASTHLGLFEVQIDGETVYAHRYTRRILKKWHLPDRLGPP